MIERLTRKKQIADAINAIDGQIAVIQDRLDGAMKRGRPAYQIHYLRGALEGLEMAREAMPTAHLTPKLEKSA